MTWPLCIVVGSLERGQDDTLLLAHYCHQSWVQLASSTALALSCTAAEHLAILHTWARCTSGTSFMRQTYKAVKKSTPRCRKYIQNNLLRSGRGAKEPLPACTLTFTAVERLQADDPHGPTTLGLRPVLIDDVIYCKSSIT